MTEPLRAGPRQAMRRGRLLALLYACSLAPRLAFVLVAGQAPLALDEIEYDRLAWSLSEGLGYVSFFGMESVFRPPGYPVFLAFVYWLGGPDYYLARIVQAFVTAAIGPLTYLLAREYFGARVACIAGFAAGLYPTIVLFTVALMSENLFIPLLLLTLLLATRLIKQPSYTLAVANGVVMLALIMIRSELSIAVALLLLWFVATAGSRRVALRQAAVIGVILVLPIAGWSYRNYVVTGQFIYLDARAGLNLYIAFNDTATGNHNSTNYLEIRDAYLRENHRRAAPDLSWQTVRKLYREEWYAYRGREFPEHPRIDPDDLVAEHWMHNRGTELAMRYLRERPLEVAALLPTKFRYFWNLEHRMLVFGYSNNLIGPLPDWLLVVLLVLLLSPFALLTLGSIFYLALHRWSWSTLPLLIPILYLTAVHTVIFGDARYHYPIVPILAIFAAAGWVHRRELLPRLRGPRALVTGTILLATVAMWGYGLAEAGDRFAAIFGEDGHRSRLDL